MYRQNKGSLSVFLQAAHVAADPASYVEWALPPPTMHQDHMDGPGLFRSLLLYYATGGTEAFALLAAPHPQALDCRRDVSIAK